MTRDCRKLHYEELHNLDSSSNIIRVLKSRRMKSACLVARKEEIKMRAIFQSEILKGRHKI
jgi:hypothetical protein